MKAIIKLNPASRLDTRELYEAPVLEAVEVKVEQGFQQSITTSPLAPGDDPNDDDLYSY
jgi:hypothetical protein